MSEIGDVIRDIEHVLLSRGAHHGLIFSDVGNIEGQGRYSEGIALYAVRPASLGYRMREPSPPAGVGAAPGAAPGITGWSMLR